jgi:hypothetical protein
VRPSGFLGYAQEALGGAAVFVLGGRVAAACERSCVLVLGVVDVLERDQPEEDVLVVAGLHAPAELVGGAEALHLDAEGAKHGGMVGRSRNQMT